MLRVLAHWRHGEGLYEGYEHDKLSTTVELSGEL